MLVRGDPLENIGAFGTIETTQRWVIYDSRALYTAAGISAVAELERENIELERAVELYRQGPELVARCEALLKSAEETLRAAADTAAPSATATALRPTTKFRSSRFSASRLSHNESVNHDSP